MSTFSVFDDAPMDPSAQKQFGDPFVQEQQRGRAVDRHQPVYPVAYSNFAAATPEQSNCSPRQSRTSKQLTGGIPHRGLHHKGSLSTSILPSIQIDRRRSVSPTSFIPRNAYVPQRSAKQTHRRTSTAYQRVQFIQNHIGTGVQQMADHTSQACGFKVSARALVLGIVSIIGLIVLVLKIQNEISMGAL